MRRRLRSCCCFETTVRQSESENGRRRSRGGGIDSLIGPNRRISGLIMSHPSEPPRMWPVLVADLADGAARDFLEGIALAGGKLFVPLNAPPENGAVHVLEIHVPGMEPLIVLAEPAGAPTPVGYPLRLRPYDPNAVPRPRDSVPNSAPEVRAPLAQAPFSRPSPMAGVSPSTRSPRTILRSSATSTFRTLPSLSSAGRLRVASCASIRSSEQEE